MATNSPKSINSSNFPNPFNPDTKIIYSVSKKSNVSIKIFNVKGQLVYYVNEGDKGPGDYEIRWSGQDNSGNPLSGGIYIYQIKVGEIIQNGRMTLMK